jgi:hypothetical protein
VSDLAGLVSKNVELHENQLMNSQNFKFIDEFENELAATSFTMRTLYSRTKSGRPQTSKGLFSPSNIIHNDEDLVSQQFHNFEENKQNEIIYEIEEDEYKKSGTLPFNKQDSKTKLDKVEELPRQKENQDKEVKVDHKEGANPVVEGQEGNQPAKEKEEAPKEVVKAPEETKKEQHAEELKKEEVKEEVKKVEQAVIKEEIKQAEVKKEEVKEEAKKEEQALNNIDGKAQEQSKPVAGNKVPQPDLSQPSKSPMLANSHSNLETSPKKALSQEPKDSPIKERDEPLITNNNNINTENNESAINVNIS